MKKLYHRLRLWVYFSLIIWLTSIGAPDGFSSSLLVTFKEGQIYKMDPTSGQQAPIFRPNYEWYYERSLSVSPNDTFFAFIERKRGEFYTQEAARQGRYDVLPKLYLRIINYKGELTQTIEDAQRYVWSRDGNEVVYITGSYYEGGVGFSPRGVRILNVLTGEKKEIKDFPIPHGPYALHWPKFENAIYIKNLASVAGEKVYYTTSKGERKFYFKDGKRVIRYDCQTGQLSITDYKDIHFSPDGNYYIHFPDEVDLNFKLYRVKTNKDITDYLPNNLGSPSGWVFNYGHFLLFIKKEVITETEGTGKAKRIVSQEIRNVQNFIFDVENKKVIEEFDGQISSWIGNGNKLVVEREGKITFEEIPEEE